MPSVWHLQKLTRLYAHTRIVLNVFFAICRWKIACKPGYWTNNLTFPCAYRFIAKKMLTETNQLENLFCQIFLGMTQSICLRAKPHNTKIDYGCLKPHFLMSNKGMRFLYWNNIDTKQFYAIYSLWQKVLSSQQTVFYILKLYNQIYYSISK